MDASVGTVYYRIPRSSEIEKVIKFPVIVVDLLSAKPLDRRFFISPRVRRFCSGIGRGGSRWRENSRVESKSSIEVSRGRCGKERVASAGERESEKRKEGERVQ